VTMPLLASGPKSLRAARGRCAGDRIPGMPEKTSAVLSGSTAVPSDSRGYRLGGGGSSALTQRGCDHQAADRPFRPEYRYQEALQQLIEAKTKGLAIKPRAVSTPSPVIDLRAALKRSLAQEPSAPEQRTANRRRTKQASDRRQLARSQAGARTQARSGQTSVL
jgi:hypothetical protein